MRRARHERLPRAAALPALLLLLSLAPAPARAETVWVDGYELEVTLRPAKVVLGESVALWLVLTNRSDTDLELLLSGRGGRGWPDGFEVSVAGAGGAKPAGGRAAEADKGPSTVILRAGQTLNVVTPLEDWATLERPGLYTVAYRRGLRAAPYDGRETVLMDVEKPAVEFVVSAPVEITGGGDRAGALIGELGAAMLKPAPDAAAAADRLSRFEDERVLRHFVEAYRRSRNATVKTIALKVFARFESDLALEGLKLGAADPNDDFRTAAAAMLSRSRHPRAARVLAGMRRDPYYGVRLLVLYELQRMRTRAARRMIWEMADDPHEGVRSEALRFLQMPDSGGAPPTLKGTNPE